MIDRLATYDVLPSDEAKVNLRHTILLVDGSDRDSFVHKALTEILPVADLRIANYGEETVAYLRRCGVSAVPCASLILLNFNMPCVRGRATLAQIKADPQLRTTPLVVLVAGHTRQDVCDCYNLGANSVIATPASLAALTIALHDTLVYWFEIVKLPIPPGGR
jgi:CheY-like chemotaxis protein